MILFNSARILSHEETYPVMMLQQNAMRCCLFQNMHSIHASRFVICYAVCRANSFRFLPLKALILERFALFCFLVKNVCSSAP